MAAAGDEPPDLPPTPDFDSYPIEAAIGHVAAEDDGRVVRLTWSDGRESRYHAIWLRDNGSDPENLNLGTREQNTDITAIPPDIRAAEASVDSAGALVVRWTPGETVSRFHPGWLRVHDYSHGRRQDDAAGDKIVWDGASLPVPPTFDGAAILEDDTVLEDWLRAIAAYGIGLLRDVPAAPGMVARVAARIGPVRETNFGRLYDVQVRTGPGSNAYSAMALTPHTDLPTREYQPGLQFLHCVTNDAAGGAALMVDGLRLARHFETEEPAVYRALTEIPWPCSNRAEDTDYRWEGPVIRLDPAGRVAEVRVVPFIRAPLAVPFEQVDEAYGSLRAFFAAVNDPAFQMRFDYHPGDLVGMDNRRVLHGRAAYDPAAGERWLQGCYVEREELDSRLRILARRRREREVVVG